MPRAPPPPPPQQKLLNGNKAPTSNGVERKSPQSFEPPPFGFRPEIKIPSNPMAALRPVPKPKPKDDFWVEEYRKERSKSPMVQEGERTEAPAHQSAMSPAPASVSPIQTTPTPPTNTTASAQLNNNNTFVERPVVECERIDRSLETLAWLFCTFNHTSFPLPQPTSQPLYPRLHLCPCTQCTQPSISSSSRSQSPRHRARSRKLARNPPS